MRTRLEFREDVAWLTMDDGKVNALSESLLREIAGRIDAAREAPAIALVGRPGIFSAGFDMPTFSRGADATVAMLQAGIDLIRTMLSHPRPIVTGCAGHAFPMGAFLLLSADWRLGVPGPFQIGMNEVAIGLTVPRFALALAQHRLTPIGYARIATGKMFTPEQAMQLGYLDELTTPEDLERAVLRAAQEMCSLDADAYARTKARLHGPLLQTLAELRSDEAVGAELAEATA